MLGVVVHTRRRRRRRRRRTGWGPDLRNGVPDLDFSDLAGEELRDAVSGAKSGSSSGEFISGDHPI
jgi:hypothetical protein